ncbi:ATP-binding protein [Candidatus Falkowbacteria bacterium]|nr:ATP-binding protein [Candidatus Falkowbacteria bacterium]
MENPEYLKSFNVQPFNIFDLLPKRPVKQIVLIDEIQYLADPSNFLKLLYDERREKIKIIATGSSSFYIDRKFKDSLAGRKFIFNVYPLNFGEFLKFNGEAEMAEEKSAKKLSSYYKTKLEKLWEQYIIYGGYPKVALAKKEDLKKILIEDIGSSYIKKDALEAGIKNTDKYYALIKILAGQTGQLMNSQKLANTLNLAHKTVEEYLYIMARSYQLAFIRPFYKNLRKELTKMPKAYFYDLGLRNFFLNDFRAPDKRSDKGAYLENLVFTEFLKRGDNLDSIKYWRTQDKKEVDFIVGREAYEIKYNTKSKPSNYKIFIKQYPEIKFSMISREDIIKKFYGWKTV